MPPLNAFEESVVITLEETRSVRETADRLSLSVDKVQRVALMAFGLGHLEVDLKDY